MKKLFSFTSYGKWILMGEHSVLRGGAAIVFPCKKYAIKSHLDIRKKKTQIKFAGPYGRNLSFVFDKVLVKALQIVGKKKTDLAGIFSLESHVPLGVGLGASAAICVTLGRCFFALGWVKERDIYEFSRNLEGLFHGESSGVDIAASLSTVGLRFTKEQILPIQVNWQPQWFLSYCGQPSFTSKCVAQVKDIWKKNPSFGKKIDEKMREAVDLTESALSMDRERGLVALSQAMDLARNCFRLWRLDQGCLSEHMKHLLSQGALAVKPTGSGGGGYVVSLWDTPPPDTLKVQLLDPNSEEAPIVF